MDKVMRTCIYETLGYADIVKGMQKIGRPRPGGVMAQARKAASTPRPARARPGGPAGPCSANWPFMGGTVSQLWQLFRRTHDWFVRPLPALSPLVSLSLSFHIHAHKIYWCLCSRTDSGPSLFLIFWSPFPTGCWPCTHWRHAVLKHAGQGGAVGRADGPLHQSYPQSLC